MSDNRFEKAKFMTLLNVCFAGLSSFLMGVGFGIEENKVMRVMLVVGLSLIWITCIKMLDVHIGYARLIGQLEECSRFEKELQNALRDTEH